MAYQQHVVRAQDQASREGPLDANQPRLHTPTSHTLLRSSPAGATRPKQRCPITSAVHRAERCSCDNVTCFPFQKQVRCICPSVPSRGLATALGQQGASDKSDRASS